MPAILDALTTLLPAGVISSNTDGAALQISPRLLPTSAWVISMVVPPAAAATFSLAVSNVQGSGFTTIATFQWPAGTSGSKQVPIGLGGNQAWVLDNDSLWLRCSVTTAGSLTLAGAWLTKKSDGTYGIAKSAWN